MTAIFGHLTSLMKKSNPFLQSVQSYLQSEMFLSNSVDMMKNLLEKVYSLTLVPPMDYLFYPQQTILENHDWCQLSPGHDSFLKHSKWIWNLRFLLQNVFHAFFGLILLIQLHTPYKKLATLFFTNGKAQRYVKPHCGNQNFSWLAYGVYST